MNIQQNNQKVITQTIILLQDLLSTKYMPLASSWI